MRLADDATRPTGPATPTGAARWRGLAVEVAANFVLPFLIYLAAKPSVGEVHALILSAGPPLVWSVIEVLRARRLDAMSIIVLAGIGLSLLGFVGSGSARVLQLREKLVTLAIGLAFLGSLAFDRPLIWHLARATSARRSAEEAARLETVRDRPELKRLMRRMTLVWGLGLVAEFAVSVALIYAMSVEDFLIVGPIVGYGTLAALALWTVRAARAARRDGT